MTAADDTDREEREREACERWGLRRFKSYEESYRPRTAKFSVLRSYSYNHENAPNRQQIKIGLDRDQVAVIFTVSMKIGRQIKVAKARLERRRKEWAGRLKHRELDSIRKDGLLRALRIIDALRQKKRKTHAKLAEILCAGASASDKDKDPKGVFDNARDRGERFMTDGYLVLALMGKEDQIKKRKAPKKEAPKGKAAAAVVEK
ncbi:MAG: hypothetical protein IH628_03825 [Proteobacteria bacterium]|nr:hypothetical protein [Pseudomonadota bacterium]